MISAIFYGLLLTALADIESNLKVYCPIDESGSYPGYYEWSESTAPAETEWTWETTWQADEANGATVYPAGFQRYTLGWYNNPPICMKVEGSHDKKVEILLESDTENANLCLHDASDMSVDLNEVGSVSNCGTGKLYACFTAATAEDTADTSSGEDFGFYVFCNGSGCEQSDLTVRMRIRLSEQSWDDGKTDLTDDLEHWCEYERGTNIEDHVSLSEGDNGYGESYYTYPSDLLPDNPSQFPFHITHLGYSSSTGFVRPSIWLTLLAAMGLAMVVYN